MVTWLLFEKRNRNDYMELILTVITFTATHFIFQLYFSLYELEGRKCSLTGELVTVQSWSWRPWESSPYTASRWEEGMFAGHHSSMEMCELTCLWCRYRTATLVFMRRKSCINSTPCMMDMLRLRIFSVMTCHLMTEMSSNKLYWALTCSHLSFP